LRGHVRCAAHANFRGRVAAQPASAAPPTPTSTLRRLHPPVTVVCFASAVSSSRHKPTAYLRQHAALAPS
jgi:hypothetical protein